MGMKIGGGGVPPVQPEEVGKAERSEKAPATAGDPALTIENAPDRHHGAGGGPLGMEELLPAPNFAAQKRVFSALTTSGAGPAQPTAQAPQTTSVGATQPPQTQPSQGSDLTMKIDPNTADSNAAMAAMMQAGWAQIQAQQTSGRSEDEERKSDLKEYESQMDDAVGDLKSAAKATFTGAMIGGVTSIVGGAFSAIGAARGGDNAESAEKPGGWTFAGGLTSGVGGMVKAGYDRAATDDEGKEKEAEKEAGIFQSGSANAEHYRDTYYQTQTSVIQALQTVIQQEGAAEETAASGRA